MRTDWNLSSEFTMNSKNSTGEVFPAESLPLGWGSWGDLGEAYRCSSQFEAPYLAVQPKCEEESLVGADTALHH